MEPNFCVDCKHYRPRKDLFSLFGWVRRESALWAECAVSVAPYEGTTLHLVDPRVADATELLFCTTMRARVGEICPKFEARDA